jgi:hypothetical protein
MGCVWRITDFSQNQQFAIHRSALVIVLAPSFDLAVGVVKGEEAVLFKKESFAFRALCIRSRHSRVPMLPIDGAR